MNRDDYVPDTPDDMLHGGLRQPLTAADILQRDYCGYCGAACETNEDSPCRSCRPLAEG
ncbi:hypothetical protein AAVH_37696 [Aphelenchoides avenae]|nr:hypothetical protein AAVH_37696 [Aphelenchus avenae]